MQWQLAQDSNILHTKTEVSPGDTEEMKNNISHSETQETKAKKKTNKKNQYAVHLKKANTSGK